MRSAYLKDCPRSEGCGSDYRVCFAFREVTPVLLTPCPTREVSQSSLSFSRNFAVGLRIFLLSEYKPRDCAYPALADALNMHAAQKRTLHQSWPRALQHIGSECNALTECSFTIRFDNVAKYVSNSFRNLALISALRRVDSELFSRTPADSDAAAAFFSWSAEAASVFELGVIRVGPVALSKPSTIGTFTCSRSDDS